MRILVQLKLVLLALAWLSPIAFPTVPAGTTAEAFAYSPLASHPFDPDAIQSPPPEITTDPPSGRSGAPFIVKGSAFVAGGEVALYWDSTDVEGGSGIFLGRAKVVAGGIFDVETAVPQGARLGPHRVIAVGIGEAEDQQAVTLFTVIDPVIALRPTSGEIGSKVAVEGVGFTPFGTVEVFWQGTQRLGSAVVMADGTTSLVVVIPDNAEVGQNRLSALDRVSGALAAATFLTTAASTPTNTATPTVTDTPSPTTTPTPSTTATPSPTWTATATPTPSPSGTATTTPTPSPSLTPTATGSPTVTGSPTSTATPTGTGTPTATLTPCGPPLGWQAYSVQAGDTLYSLANSFGATVAALKLANCLTGDAIMVGQKLFVPAVTLTLTPTTSPTGTPSPALTPTDTATATGTVPVAPADATATLVLSPPPSPSPTVPPTTAPPVAQVTPTISCQPRTDWLIVETVPGDTLDSVAQRYRVTVAEILLANCRPAGSLTSGERLYLPPLPRPESAPNLWPIAIAGMAGLAIVGAAYFLSQELGPVPGSQPAVPGLPVVPPPLKAIEGFARAGIPGVRPGEPLRKDHKYTLIAGLTKEIPASFETEPTASPSVHGEVELEMAVFAEDIEVLPESVRHLRLRLSDLGQVTDQFTIIPRATGVKKIQLDFRYRRHWLQTVTFHVAVSDNGLAAIEAPPDARVAAVAGTRLEAFAELPLLAHEDYPVDVHVRIYPDGHRFRAEINNQRVPLELTLHDVAALNRQMRDVLYQVVVEGQMEPQEGLQRLAYQGSYAFRRIFGHPTAEETIRGALAMGGHVTLQIASEDFFVPWELLYDRDPNATDLAYEHFWGMRYLISRAIVQEARPGAFVPPVITVATKPAVGLVSYSKLPSVVEREIPFFEMLDSGQQIILYKLAPLDPADRRGALVQFAAFWNQGLDLAHFACHVVADAASPAQSRLVLTRECPISLLDMDVFRIQFANHPLVVLNACETGNLNPLYTSYFAAAFLRSGARGVVATEGPVPDDFASEFAGQLYSLLLRGTPLGDSLLLTRRHFLHTHDDPSGLLYSLYAPPTIRIRRGTR